MQADKTKDNNLLLAQIDKAEVPIKFYNKTQLKEQQKEKIWRKSISDNNFYKIIFSIKRFYLELVVKVLPEHAQQLLDLKTLKRLPETVHTFTNKERLSDMVFIAQYKNDHEKHAIIDLEFQTTPQKNFPWRMFEYKCALLNNLKGKYPEVFKGKKLPRVFMIAYYNGDRNWNVPRDTVPLFQEPEHGDSENDVLKSMYYLFDARHETHKKLEETLDLSSLIIRIERAFFLAKQTPKLKSNQEKTLSLVFELMNLAKKLADELDDDERLINWHTFENILLWCDNITLTLTGIRAFLLRKEPEAVMKKAMTYFDELVEESMAKGIAKGRAEKTASDICNIFKFAFKTAAPEKLVKLVSSLQKKGDQNNLDKLQKFIYEEKGSKDDFLRYAESLGA